MKNEIARQIDEHLAVARALSDQADVIETIAERTVASLGSGGRMYLLGNGGSAADAQHIAGELVGRFAMERRGWPVLALSTDTSVLTAVGNDYGFDDLFRRQIEAHNVGPADVVWAFSTSGNSENVVRAARLARERGAATIGFTGKSGGRLAEYCDLCLRAAHATSCRIQEAHMLAYHILCGLIEAELSRQTTTSDEPPS